MRRDSLDQTDEDQQAGDEQERDVKIHREWRRLGSGLYF